MRANIVTRFLQGGGLSLAKLVTGIIRIKIIAVVLGVGGVGSLSLALQFQGAVVALVSMSLAVGVINLGRPLWIERNVEQAGAIVGTALGMVGLNSVVFLCLFLLFDDVLLNSFSGAIDAHIAFWPIAIAAVAVSFANAIGEGLLFLMDRFDLYVRVNIFVSIVDVFLFGMGAWLFGLQGALFAALASSITLVVAYWIISSRTVSAHQLIGQLSWAASWTRPLLSYSMVMVVTTGFGLTSLFVARAHVIAVSGVTSNGLLQVITALAAYLLPFVMSGVWGHLHPYVAALGDCEEARKELRKVLLATVRIGVAGCTIIVIGGQVLVPLAYTPTFLGALHYLDIYFIGEIFFICISVFGAYLISAGLRRAYFFGYFGYYALLLLGVFVGTDHFGIWAYVGAHIVASCAVFIGAGYYSISRQQLTSKELILVACWALPLVLICLLQFSASPTGFFDYQRSVAFAAGSVLIVVALGPYLMQLRSKYATKQFRL